MGRGCSEAFCARRCLMAVLAARRRCAAAHRLQSARAADKKKEPADKIVISGASGGLAGETIDALLGARRARREAHSRHAHAGEVVFICGTRRRSACRRFHQAGVVARRVCGRPAAAVDQHERRRSRRSAYGCNQCRAPRRHQAHRLHLVDQRDLETIRLPSRAIIIATEDALRKSGVPYTILRNQLLRGWARRARREGHCCRRDRHEFRARQMGAGRAQGLRGGCSGGAHAARARRQDLRHHRAGSDQRAGFRADAHGSHGQVGACGGCDDDAVRCRCSCKTGVPEPLARTWPPVSAWRRAGIP